MSQVFLCAAALLLAACDVAERADEAPVEPRTAANDASPAPVAVPVSRELVAIPARFVGSFAADTANCGEHGEMSLEIEPNRLKFYESTGIPNAVEAVEPDIVTVTAEFTGEGEKWTRSYRFALAADGKTLIATSDGNSVTRVRCPA